MPRMSPRAYAMTSRKAAMDMTRRRIVEAAARLHARHGAARTAWEDIAAEAHVSRATVYNHFPSLAELVPACAHLAFDLAAIPTRREAAARFAGRTPADRLKQFVVESCRCYRAGAPWLRAAWRERELVPEMGAAVERLQRALGVLLRAALDDVELDRKSRSSLLVLLDFPFWDALQATSMADAEVAAQILLLAETVVRDGRRKS